MNVEIYEVPLWIYVILLLSVTCLALQNWRSSGPGQLVDFQRRPWLEVCARGGVFLVIAYMFARPILTSQGGELHSISDAPWRYAASMALVVLIGLVGWMSLREARRGGHHEQRDALPAPYQPPLWLRLALVALLVVLFWWAHIVPDFAYDSGLQTFALLAVVVVSWPLLIKHWGRAGDWQTRFSSEPLSQDQQWRLQRLYCWGLAAIVTVFVVGTAESTGRANRFRSAVEHGQDPSSYLAADGSWLVSALLLSVICASLAIGHYRISKAGGD